MTRIDQSAVVTRETSSLHRGRALIVTLHPKFIEIWPKGSRGKSVFLHYEASYDQRLKATDALERASTRRRSRLVKP